MEYRDKIIHDAFKSVLEKQQNEKYGRTLDEAIRDCKDEQIKDWLRELRDRRYEEYGE